MAGIISFERKLYDDRNIEVESSWLTRSIRSRASSWLAPASTIPGQGIRVSSGDIQNSTRLEGQNTSQHRQSVWIFNVDLLISNPSCFCVTRAAYRSGWDLALPGAWLHTSTTTVGNCTGYIHGFVWIPASLPGVPRRCSQPYNPNEVGDASRCILQGKPELLPPHTLFGDEIVPFQCQSHGWFLLQSQSNTS